MLVENIQGHLLPLDCLAPCRCQPAEFCVSKKPQPGTKAPVLILRGDISQQSARSGRPGEVPRPKAAEGGEWGLQGSAAGYERSGPLHQRGDLTEGSETTPSVSVNEEEPHPPSEGKLTIARRAPIENTPSAPQFLVKATLPPSIFQLNSDPALTAVSISTLLL